MKHNVKGRLPPLIYMVIVREESRGGHSLRLQYDSNHRGRVWQDL